MQLVYSCEQTKEKDDKGDRKEKYKVRFTYEIDGTTYDDFDTYYKEIRKGDTVLITVYRNSKGKIQIGTGTNSDLLPCICCNDSAGSHWSSLNKVKILSSITGKKKRGKDCKYWKGDGYKKEVDTYTK